MHWIKPALLHSLIIIVVTLATALVFGIAESLLYPAGTISSLFGTVSTILSILAWYFAIRYSAIRMHNKGYASSAKQIGLFSGVLWLAYILVLWLLFLRGDPAASLGYILVAGVIGATINAAVTYLYVSRDRQNIRSFRPQI